VLSWSCFLNLNSLNICYFANSSRRLGLECLYPTLDLPNVNDGIVHVFVVCGFIIYEHIKRFVLWQYYYLLFFVIIYVFKLIILGYDHTQIPFRSKCSIVHQTWHLVKCGLTMVYLSVSWKHLQSVLLVASCCYLGQHNFGCTQSMVHSWHNHHYHVRSFIIPRFLLHSSCLS
jgi:hypothetical protein